MRQWVLYKDKVAQVINSSSSDMTHIRVEFLEGQGIGSNRRTWLPREDCAFMEKCVLDIILSNQK